MGSVVRIQEHDFDIAAEWAACRRRCGDAAGAVVAFGGLVRDHAGDDAVRGLYLEHYPGMTEASIEAIVDQATARWTLLDVLVIHRVGELAPGDQIVLVLAAAGHRPDAFAACEFLMDYLKTDAVFWKKERRVRDDAWINATSGDRQRRADWQSTAKGSCTMIGPRTKGTIHMGYEHIKVPTTGEKITVAEDGSLNVPNRPIVPFITGDGIGVDVTPVMLDVVNAAVENAYNGQRQIAWMEVYSGKKSLAIYGENEWLPEETLAAMREFLVAIKGPMTTPVGGGIRSLNVALRQRLDLYVCLRPVRWLPGVPSPVKAPEKTDMVIFRENTEDIYAGVEWEAGSEEADRVIAFLRNDMGVEKIRFPTNCGIGIKPASLEGTQRLVRKALQYAIAEDRDSVTLVHKGNIMKFTEGAFKDWGYALAVDEFGATPLDGGPWHALTNPNTGKRIVVKDMIADAMLQQILTRPDEYDVIATMNLNGDYLSDALAAQVGGIGIAPGANLGDAVALFEATHGTAPKYAGQDKVNPGSLILSAEMMLRHLGWREAADLIVQGMEGAIADKTVTYDFERLMTGASLLKCSQFGAAVIAKM